MRAVRVLIRPEFLAMYRSAGLLFDDARQLFAHPTFQIMRADPKHRLVSCGRIIGL